MKNLIKGLLHFVWYFVCFCFICFSIVEAMVGFALISMNYLDQKQVREEQLRQEALSAYYPPLDRYKIEKEKLSLSVNNVVTSIRKIIEVKEQEAQIFKHRFHTLAHARLDKEFAIYAVSQKHYKTVDNLIRNAGCAIAANDMSNHGIDEANRAEMVLSVIDRTIKQINTGYKRQQLLSKAIDEKRFDCDTLATLFVSVGQSLNLPIKLVTLPGHVFVRYKLSDGSYVSWETTTGKSFDETEFCRKNSFLMNDLRELGAHDYLEEWITNDLFFEIIIKNQ